MYQAVMSSCREQRTREEDPGGCGVGAGGGVQLCQLCDPGQVTHRLWPSPPITVKWGQ